MPQIKGNNIADKALINSAIMLDVRGFQSREIWRSLETYVCFCHKNSCKCNNTRMCAFFKRFKLLYLSEFKRFGHVINTYMSKTLPEILASQVDFTNCIKTCKIESNFKTV